MVFFMEIWHYCFYILETKPLIYIINICAYNSKNNLNFETVIILLFLSVHVSSDTLLSFILLKQNHLI